MMSDLGDTIQPLAPLPQDHPRYQEALRDLLPANPTAAAQLAAAGADFNQLKTLLIDRTTNPELTPSPELLARLAQIPQRHVPEKSTTRRLFLPVAIAAALLLACWLGWNIHQRHKAAALRQFARNALDTVLASPRISAIASRGQLLRQLTNLKLDFKPVVYDYSGFHLTGYAVCQVGGRTALLTRWQSGPLVCSMLQMAARTKWPVPIAMRNVELHGKPATTGGFAMPYTITVWHTPASDCDWAMVRLGTDIYTPTLYPPKAD